jgi:hypothetical protein
MKNILITLIIFLSVQVSISSASEVTGTLSTGLSGSVNDSLTGTVVTPERRGGGGGGGSVTPKIVATSTVATTTILATTTASTTSVIPVLIPVTSLTIRYQFVNDLMLGSKGSDVIELQKFLTSQGVYSGPVTGNFGPLTLEAVKAYQAKENLPSTGYVGTMTRESLNRSKSISISQFVELLIQIGVISADKAKNAREIMNII